MGIFTPVRMYLYPCWWFSRGMTNTPADPRPSLNEAVAAVLRSERSAQKLTLDELATATAIPRVSLQRYLAGTRAMDVDQLASIAKALRLDVAEVLADAQRRLARSAAPSVTMRPVDAPVADDEQAGLLITREGVIALTGDPQPPAATPDDAPQGRSSRARRRDR